MKESNFENELNGFQNGDQLMGDLDDSIDVNININQMMNNQANNQANNQDDVDPDFSFDMDENYGFGQGGQNDQDVSFDMDGDFVFGQDALNNQNNQIQEQDLYYRDDPEDNMILEPGENLYEGILGEEAHTLENEWATFTNDEINNAKEADRARIQANLAAEQERKAKEEEKKKAEEAKKAETAAKKAEEERIAKEKKEMEAPKRHFASKYEQGVAEYNSEQRGYKDKEFEDGETLNTAREFHVMKYTMRELSYGTFKRSPEMKKLLKDMDAFDTFMKEIEGRKNLTPREMEVYDKLSLKVYKSGKEYREHLQEKHEKNKAAFDEKHKNDKYHIEYSDYPEDIAKLEGTNQVLDQIETMRKKLFEKQMEEKQKELTEKCQKEAQKAESIRDEMESTNDPAKQSALQSQMEDSIARSLFYNNRIEKLTKQGEFAVKPDESLTKAMERLDKAAQPKPEELAEIKNTELCKSLVIKGMDKLRENDMLSNEEIVSAQKEYTMAEGSKKRLAKWREQNMRPASRNNEANMNNQRNLQNQPQNQQQNPQLTNNNMVM